MYKHLLLAAALVFTTSCGGSTADDIGNAFAALTSDGQSTVMAKIREQVSQARVQANAVKMRAQQQQLDASLSAMTTTPGALCSGGMMEIEGGTCGTPECNYDASAVFSMRGSCSFSGDSVSCGEETYTFNNGSFDYDFHVTNQLFTIVMNMSGNVKGGKLDGDIACSIRMALDLASLETDSEQELDCNNVSCTYDGDPISCEDLQNGMNNDDAQSC